MIYRDIVFRYSRLVKVEGRVFSGIYNVATFEDTKISPSPWYETLQEMNATAREQILLSLKSEISYDGHIHLRTMKSYCSRVESLQKFSLRKTIVAAAIRMSLLSCGYNRVHASL